MKARKAAGGVLVTEITLWRHERDFRDFRELAMVVLPTRGVQRIEKCLEPSAPWRRVAFWYPEDDY